MILVVGSTGLVGLDICERLRRRGESVRALVRASSDPQKKERLQAIGADLVEADLKRPDTLGKACEGVTAIVSTASATLSRQDGDTIETVDRDGQLALVDIAQSAGARRFVYISFRNNPDLQYPLRNAKTAVEERLRQPGIDYTILQASYFMEVWLSPALGFDYAGNQATVFGDGSNKLSWVSSGDVAAAAVACLFEPRTIRKTIEFGGPEALSPLEVTSRFEKAGWGEFALQHVPVEKLRADYEAAEDPLQKTFAALQLQYALGDPIDMSPALELLPLELASVDDYAARLRKQTPTA